MAATGIEDATFRDALLGLESTFGRFVEPIASALNDTASAIGEVSASLDRLETNAPAIERLGNQVVATGEIVAEPLARIASHLVSPNESDSNLEPANVVDGLFAIARAITHLADAVASTSK